MSFIYLATPYSKYKDGLEEANRLACEYTATLIKHKLPVFCPIAHSHNLAVNTDLAAMDHSIWMPLDFAFTEAAFAMVVCCMDGWDESYGVKKEIEFFKDNNKPIYYWNPPELSKDLLYDLKEEFLCHKQTHKSILVPSP